MSDIEDMAFTTPFVKDYSPLYDLKQSKALSLSIPNIKVGTPKVKLGFPDVKIDVSRIPSLEELHVDRSQNIINLDKCKNLKELVISLYNPSNKDLEELSNTLLLLSNKYQVDKKILPLTHSYGI